MTQQPSAPTTLQTTSEWIRDSPLPLIPVLDLKGGRVVRGNGGNRGAYSPWHSSLCPSADPGEFATAAMPLVGHDRLYVADIDALRGGPPDCQWIAKLAATRRVWCDIGVRDRQAAQRLAGLVRPGGQDGAVVLASETAVDLASMESILDAEPPNQFAVSFDWRGPTLLSPGGWLNRDNWLDAACRLADRGVRRFLLVDLDAVGSGRGASRWQECRQLRQRVTDAEIVAGGGVATRGDVETLQQAGCDAVLIASGLHQAGGSKKPVEYKER